MRLSSTKGDPGHDLWSLYTPKQRSQIVVTLDGVEMTEVSTADDEEGMVEVWVRDARGNLVVDSEKHEIKTEVRRGKVVIQLPEAP